MKHLVFPDSVRLDPVNLRLYEHQPKLYRKTLPADFLRNNPVWNERENRVTLRAAGNETVAFQVALITEKEIPDVRAELKPFTGPADIPEQCVELFKEWFVEVHVPSSGYEKSTLGPGWYPDALIPLTARPPHYGAPFYVPDYWNRIKGQKAAVLWADLYIPRQQKAGLYTSTLAVSCKEGPLFEVPIEVRVWPFSLPEENSLKGNLYTNSFRRMSLDKELRYQHLFRKHRMVAHQCYYRPDLCLEGDEPVLDWTAYDTRLAKYFDGSAFTSSHGYFGPGAGVPLEQLLLPFNCSGKKGAVGWPLDTKGTKDERFWTIWDKTARQVRRHLFDEKRVGPKTQIQIFFNALDECYKREDHERMIMWSVFMKKHFPGALFRIDGGYTDETMEFLAPHVDLCLWHTAGYDLPLIEKYRKRGVIDWIYGPVVYESKTNELTGASTFIDLDLLTMRGLSWICFKYGTDSWCQWEFAHENKKAWYNPENFKNHSLEQFRCYNGNGMMLYDGEFMDLPDPCASIRFKAARSGAQEYEYLKLLKSLGGNPDAVVDALIDRPLGPGCHGNLEPWCTDIAAWDDARIKLGEKIAKRV